MLGVGLVYVFHTEGVDAKGEGYFAANVSKEPECVSTWHVPRGFELLFESVVGDATGLFQAVHAFLNFHYHISIYCLCTTTLV